MARKGLEQINHQYTLFWWELRSAEQPYCSHVWWAHTKATALRWTLQRKVFYSRTHWKPPWCHSALMISQTLEQLADNRTTRLELINKSYQAAEERRTLVSLQKQELHKARAASTSSNPHSSLVCPSCARSFRATNGFISHLRTHRIQSSST